MTEGLSSKTPPSFYINDATVSAMSDILFIVFFINFLVDDEVEFEQQLPATAATEQSASVAPMHFIIIFDVLTFIKIPPFSLQRFCLVGNNSLCFQL